MARNLTALAALAVCTCAAWPSFVHAQDARRRVAGGDLSRELACAPQTAPAAPAPSLRIIVGGEPGKYLFGPRDTVVVEGAGVRSLQPGQQFFIRRLIEDRFAADASGSAPVSIHTAGWLTISRVDEHVALATIADGCDSVTAGDYLEPFVHPVVPAPASGGEPDYRAPGRIILGDERRQIGAAGSMMVIDLGQRDGARPGGRATIFREAIDARAPATLIGEAAIVAVRERSSTVRIQSSRDAVHVGDHVALHK